MQDKDNLIWNAKVRSLIDDGYPIVSAFDLLSTQLKSAEENDLVSGLIYVNASPKKPHTLEVSYDALKIIIDGWEKYYEDNRKGLNTKLGQAMGLEGEKQGLGNALKMHIRRERNVGFAVQVTQLIEKGHTKSEAIEIVATLDGTVGADAVRKAISPPDPEKLNASIKNSQT